MVSFPPSAVSIQQILIEVWKFQPEYKETVQQKGQNESKSVYNLKYLLDSETEATIERKSTDLAFKLTV